MTIIAPLLAFVAKVEARLAARTAAGARNRRERASVRALAAMGDDQLHDLGITREGVRCGLSARREPMRAVLACRTDAPVPARSDAERRMDALREGSRWGEARVYPERHLGW